MEKYLIIISLFVLISYCIFAYLKVGMRKSISDTYYPLRDEKLGFIFQLFIVGLTVPIIYYAKSYSTLLMFSAIFILVVFFTPNTKNDAIQSRNHVIGASGGIVLGFAAMVVKIDWQNFFSSHFMYFAVGFLLAAFIIMPIPIVKKGVKNHTTWIEIVSCLIILIGFLTE